MTLLAFLIGCTGGSATSEPVAAAKELHVYIWTNYHSEDAVKRFEEKCACNQCPHMKLNTLEKVYISLKYEMPEVDVPEPLRSQALLPIQRMLEISAQLGL